jgi:hypothetical protein
MGLVTNGTLSYRTEFPNRNFPKLFVNGKRPVYFLFSKAQPECHVINYFNTNPAWSSRTGEYCPSIVFARTELRSGRTTTISAQYFPVRPSRSGSKRLLLAISRFFGLRLVGEKLKKTENNGKIGV